MLFTRIFLSAILRLTMVLVGFMCLATWDVITLFSYSILVGLVVLFTAVIIVLARAAWILEDPRLPD
jgi:hypothetical protein